jgi:PIN domain nuclease of toxin-antitoxin system
MKSMPGMSDLHLLDTHVLLWAVAAPHRLKLQVRALVESRRYAASVASLWELLNKKDKPDAPVKDPVAWWNEYVVGPQTRVLAIQAPHVSYLDRLPWLHRDPYDRILIAQAMVEKMVLVTSDDHILKYSVETLHA